MAPSRPLLSLFALGLLACKGSTDTNSPASDSGESPVLVGCDGVPGSGMSFDACWVCGGDTPIEDDCSQPLTLGYVVSAEEADEPDAPYDCLDSDAATTWMECNRDPYREDCPHEGREVSFEDPVDAQAACEAIFGRWGPAHDDYPAEVSERSEVDVWVESSIAPEWAPECSRFECLTDWCAGEDDGLEPPPACAVDATPPAVVTDRSIWWVPEWTPDPANSGFFGKQVDGPSNIQWASADVSWRQIVGERGEPPYSTTDTDIIRPGHTSTSEMDVLAEVLAGDRPFWLRMFVAEEEWAPEWIWDECGVDPITVVREDDPPSEVPLWTANYVPIWDDCVWDAVMDAYTWLLGPKGLDLLADDRMLLAYVPGAFKWAEYGLSAIEDAVDEASYKDGPGDATDYSAWFLDRMVAELVAINPDYAHKLVFTGEDFPYSVPDAWDDDISLIDHLPMRAIEAGISIRNGITENHSSHHYHMPAYGTFVAWDGHVVAAKDWHAYDGNRILATEQECFAHVGSCGRSPEALEGSDEWIREIRYGMHRANLISLQARMNYIYTKPGLVFDEVLGDSPEHWEWVRKNLSQRPELATEAWATLGAYRDKFFERNPRHDWMGRPWVQNTEKHLVQRDVCQGGRSQVSTDDAWAGDIWEDDETRMTNFEGRKTDRENKQDFIYFDVDDDFVGDVPETFDLAVQYHTAGEATWFIEYPQAGCLASTAGVTNPSSVDEVRTAWFELEDAHFTGSLPGKTDFRIYNGGADDIEIRMVRLVRRGARGCGDGVIAETEECDDGNIASGDGCSPACEVEPGWECDDAGCIPLESDLYESCMDILSAGMDVWGSGIYEILDPASGSESADTIQVYCDMDTAGGGWTVVWASMDGESAGVPWGESSEDIGLQEVDPSVGPVRLSWDRLRSLPQNQHIIIRPDWPEDWLGRPWLAVDAPFFAAALDETDCYASQIEDVRVWTSAQLDEDGELTDETYLTADLGFARDVGDGYECIEYPDEDLPCGTEPDHIRNGGWYGLALSSDDGHAGLSGESCSRKFLNGSCTDHLVYVYGDNHFATSLNIGLEWPETAECSSSSTSGNRTWIGVRNLSSSAP